MSSKTRRNRFVANRCSRRQLRFDCLEERRLLAGLHVRLFEDADGSRSNGASDWNLADKAVFVDLNRDGVLDSSEPWAVTNDKGIAVFQDLPAGNYSIRLVGQNQSVTQTFPTEPAANGVWFEGIGDIIEVESNGSLWATNGNKLSHWDRGLSQELDSIEFGNRRLLDAVWVSENDRTPINGFALTQSANDVRELWKLSGEDSLRAEVLPVNAAGFSRLEMSGEQLLVHSDIGNVGLTQVDYLQSFEVRPIGFHEGDVLEYKSVGQNQFATLENANGGWRIVVYERVNGETKTVGRRAFPSEVTQWQVSPDGQTLAVSTKDDFLVLDVRAGLPTRTILENAIEPIIFDSVRDLLITGSQSNENELLGWSMTS
ncbi:MAG: hypothetical protein ABL921_29330, partial [Pirellula sp.]